jgi:hypothetical protein
MNKKEKIGSKCRNSGERFGQDSCEGKNKR